MKRLIQGIGLNSPEEYDRIFLQRQKKGVNWADERRWKMLLKYYKPYTDLVDLGSLDSKIPQYMKQANGYYLGVDMAVKAIKAMNQNYPLRYPLNFNTLFKVGDICKLPEDLNNKFDYAVLGEVLEHLERPQDAVREAFRILRLGGILAISVPLMEENEPGAVDKHRHIWSFSTNDILELVEPYAKNVKIKILRSKYFPIYKYSWPTIICWAVKNENKILESEQAIPRS